VADLEHIRLRGGVGEKPRRSGADHERDLSSPA
jgi:hypothetical protein